MAQADWPAEYSHSTQGRNNPQSTRRHSRTYPARHMGFQRAGNCRQEPYGFEHSQPNSRFECPNHHPRDKFDHPNHVQLSPILLLWEASSTSSGRSYLRPPRSPLTRDHSDWM